VKPAAQQPSGKGGQSGGSAKIKFDFDPDLIFDVNATPQAFGEADLHLHAAAKMLATVSLQDFLGESFTADIINVAAGIKADRCSITSDETQFKIFGIDIIDPNSIPRIDTGNRALSPEAYDASQKCQSAVATFKLYGDRAKKAFRDAQQVLAQYHALRDAGNPFGPDLCQQIGIAAANVPFFPGGNACADLEPPEITINRLIDFYQNPALGEIGRLKNAAKFLSGASADLRNALTDHVKVDFIDRSEEVSRTVVNVPFAIGPIPMLLQVDIYAQYGITGRFNLDLEFPELLQSDATAPQRLAHANLGVLPHASAGVSAFVGAGLSLGPLHASIGIEGAVTLADIRVPIFAGAGIWVAVEHDLRLPEPLIRPPVSEALNLTALGTPPTSFKFFVSYDYGAAVDLLNVLSGEIDGRLRIKFFFFSRTWRKRIVSFSGWSFHFDLVSRGSSPDIISHEDNSVPAGSGLARQTTKMTEGQTTMGRSEQQVPLMKLALLQPADVARPDGGPGTGQLSKATVEKFFYDDLCCAKVNQSCADAGSPTCCPGLSCVGHVCTAPTTCQPNVGDPCGEVNGKDCCTGLRCDTSSNTCQIIIIN
jgi:hypothetical protein